MIGVVSSNVRTYIKEFKNILKKYKLEKSRYRHSLIDVTTKDNKIILHVLITGIKKHILKLNPEEVVYDDELLSEFSPCDVRAITYLSFQKYIKEEKYSLIIEGQYINKGETVFKIKNIDINQTYTLNAQKLYQDYDLLINLSRKDMIKIIATAVQEQTFLDIKSMEML